MKRLTRHLRCLLACCTQEDAKPSREGESRFVRDSGAEENGDRAALGARRKGCSALSVSSGCCGCRKVRLNQRTPSSPLSSGRDCGPAGADSSDERQAVWPLPYSCRPPGQRRENRAFLFVPHRLVVSADRLRCCRRIQHGFRKVLGNDQVGRAQHDGAFDGILEFPHVARPVISLQTGQRFRREPSQSCA